VRVVVSMVAAPLMNEADCLARQLRRTRGASKYLDLTRSAYRESGLVPWPGADPRERLLLSDSHMTSQSKGRTAQCSRL
jgi:hypothetical protein